MSEDTPEEAIERGLDAYFAGETITDVLDGIDVDALADGAPLDDAIEYEQLGKALGALIGRAAAKGASNSGLLGTFVKESAGSEIGGRAGEAFAAALTEHGDVKALTAHLRQLTNTEQLDRLVEEAIAGSDVETLGGDETDWTEIEVEDGDE